MNCLTQIDFCKVLYDEALMLQSSPAPWLTDHCPVTVCMRLVSESSQYQTTGERPWRFNDLQCLVKSHPMRNQLRQDVDRRQSDAEDDDTVDMKWTTINKAVNDAAASYRGQQSVTHWEYAEDTRASMQQTRETRINWLQRLSLVREITHISFFLFGGG